MQMRHWLLGMLESFAGLSAGLSAYLKMWEFHLKMDDISTTMAPLWMVPTCAALEMTGGASGKPRIGKPPTYAMGCLES